MSIFGRVVSHGLNYASHQAQQSGHRTLSGTIDGALRSNSSRFIRECTQDRRCERGKEHFKVRVLHQRGR